MLRPIFELLHGEALARQLTGAQIAVLIYMGERARRDGSRAFPKVGTIARQLNLSRTTVRTALRQLLKLNIGFYVERPATNRLSARYGFDLAKLRAAAESTREP